MAEHNEIGKTGEELAKEYLEKNGYKIIEQNYRTRRSEIDLVAQKSDRLIFVEVRARGDEQFGTPEETLNDRKRTKLLRNAQAYVARKKYRGPYQIDAVCIVFDGSGGSERLTHYENIVQE